MSLTQPPGAAPAARHVRNLIKGAAAAMAGRQRGPDRGEGRRVPRRNSYDVDDARAQPWRPIGDGSVAQGLAHVDALLQAAEELSHASWEAMPLREVRAARERHVALSVELQAHIDAGDAPIGRPATLRQEIGRLETYLAEADGRLRPIDVRILKAALRGMNFATGALFKSIETIAAVAGCHRNSVVGALRRLKTHGFLDWVRRTVKTDNEGQFAPQREQTSNAYFFDHKARMRPRTWARYWQILMARLRRCGTARPAPPEAAEPDLRLPSNPALRAALAGLGAAIPNAST